MTYNRQLPGILSKLIGCGFFVYILVRAYLLSFTHDEALTVLDYGSQPLWYINKVIYTNNHLLNTWWVHLCIWADLNYTFCFRLLNVFGGGLYFLFSFRLARKLFVSGWHRVFFMLMLCCHPLLLDFFSLSRGYGISFGLFMAAVYYAYRYFETGKLMLYGPIVLLLIAMASLANYTLLNILLMVIVFFVVHVIFVSWKTKKRRVLGLFIFMIPVFFFTSWFLRVMFSLRSTGNFDFGGDKGLWIDTVGSLVKSDFFHLFAFWNPLKDVMIIFSLLLFCIVSLLFIRRMIVSRFRNPEPFTILIFGLLVGSGIASLLQHHFLKIPLPVDRAALSFDILFFLFVPVVLFTEERFRLVRNSLVLLALVMTCFTFILSANLSAAILWPMNIGSERMCTTIEETSANDRANGEMKFVSVDFNQYSVFNYYTWLHHARGLNYVYGFDAGFLPYCDYKMQGIYDVDPTQGYHKIDQYAWSSLFRMDDGLVTYDTLPVITNDFERGARRITPGYKSNYCQWMGPSFSGTDVLEVTLADTLFPGSRIVVRGWLKSNSPFSMARTIFNALGSDGNLAEWKIIPSNNGPVIAGEWEQFTSIFQFASTLYPGMKVGAYLVNDNRENVFADDLSLTILNCKAAGK